jgi:hypothetical protein
MTFNENSEPAEVFLKTKTIKKDKNVKKSLKRPTTWKKEQKRT